MVRAEIITIGDEILYGQILDTNTQWISFELDKLGIKTIRKSSVGDQKSEILQILNEASNRADVVFITGGLGPTKDDITKKTLCEYFNTELVLDQISLDRVESFFKGRGLPMLEVNRQQAMVPKDSITLHNLRGTANGMWFERDGVVFVSMPGVPYEMKALIQNEVLPKLTNK